MVKFADEHCQRLRAIVDKAVSSGPGGIPGATVVVFGKDGSEPFAYSAGKRGLCSKENMTLDSVFWMASCTKMLTALACMQLVEQGILRLDDGSQLEQLCPELQKLKVLKQNGDTEPKQNGITLRMLLTHTAGFGYSFSNENIRDWGYPAGIDEFSGDIEDILQPLLFQPGEGWAYGVGIDWAGLALERAMKMRLNDYVQDKICLPLGLENVNMLPTQSMKDKLAYMHQRSPDGSLAARDHLLRRPLVVQSREQRDAMFQSGGAGIFAKPQEYCRILSVLLNNGICPRTGAKLLQPKTPDLTNPVPHLYPTEADLPQGWGLSFMLTGGATGRSSATAYWAGLANLYWWADRENGIGGLVCTQILPFGDSRAYGLWTELESAAYQGLKGQA
ncbi:beta-lactamase [Hirsutella rhossiliensis]|uniref:Beta-lactamase domain-containing protein n=1 Tax=Hirsutella rhossiliensis TaxID=111463 RepID=A0A9P8N498_9HYPO|nr:beta-lactamase domain-containing protein [Hirsutella rhossiliensis]KAH0967363.1 beta-lactamase domain-containing protein [Hirsutella rhossiliensis]